MLFAPEFPARPPARRPVARAVVGTTTLAATLLAGWTTFAVAAGAAPTVWDRVAACESSGNWSIDTGNGYYGGLQFSYTTWREFGGTAYAPTANRATRSQQILIAQRTLQVQGPGAWPVCSQRAGLTRANGLGVRASRSARPASVGGSATPLVVDGVRGPRTNRAVERWVGGSVDGALSGSDVQRLQRRVGSAPDGRMGPLTTAALQQRVGAHADGVWGPRTTSALQRFLNRILF